MFTLYFFSTVLALQLVSLFIGKNPLRFGFKYELAVGKL